jgi:hypothetical protein
MVSRFWKNKLFKFFKVNKLKFPVYTIVAKVDCVIEIENELLEYTIPIEITKKIKDESLELLYCQIYNELTTSFYNKKKSKLVSRKNENAGKNYKDNCISLDKTLVFKELPEDNIGRKILEKFGWSNGDGLGLNSDGIKTPIPITFKNDKRGLG